MEPSPKTYAPRSRGSSARRLPRRSPSPSRYPASHMAASTRPILGARWARSIDSACAMRLAGSGGVQIRIRISLLRCTVIELVSQASWEAARAKVEHYISHTSICTLLIHHALAQLIRYADGLLYNTATTPSRTPRIALTDCSLFRGQIHFSWIPHANPGLSLH